MKSFMMSKILTAGFLFLMVQAVFAHGMFEADKEAMIQGGYTQYTSLGATHMLTGYGHLLFVFGIVFFLTTFWDVIKYVTAFTLGHSITLISATLMGITVNYYLIDAVIALLYKFRRAHSFLQISSVCNNGIIIAGVFLFLMQMHGYLHTVNPDEFGFSEDNHFHAHEAMEISKPTPGSEYGLFQEGRNLE